MATTEKYTTVIELNSEQAKRNLDELRRKVESWKSDLAEAREKKMGRSFIASIRKELTAAEKELKKYDNEVARTIDTLNNIGKASVEQIEDAQKSLLRLSKEVPHDSDAYKNLTGMLDHVTQELENIKATKAFEQLQQEAAGATKSAAQVQAELAFIKQTADNAQTASVKQLQLAERTAQNIKNSAQKGSDEWNQASAGLETVRTRLTAIEEEERKVVRTIDRYNEELKKAGKEEKIVADEMELVKRTLDKLDSSSVRDIEYSIKILNEQLRDTERTGDNVEELTSKLQQLNEELRKVQDMQKQPKEKGSIFSRMIKGLNTNWGAITQITSAVTGLSTTIRSVVQSYADMEEEMADVRKYTGMTVGQVRELNEEFKQMDTRTSREQLNRLAGEAGRLGIQTKEGVKEFVDAADKINVALGEDLGDGAVGKVGKLAMAFGEDDRLGLRGAMLATGSAVNELVQNSSAQAGYLVDFTARVAGFGKQIGLTQTQIMGFGTVMDENMLRDEMAATAFGNMLAKMQTDTAVFAKIAGKDVEDFTKLLREDANNAILAVAESLKRQDPTTMMKMLDAMGLDGSRAVGVLATLADKIDDVRMHQERASEAYRKGNSVLSEFNVKNNTVQARLDKCKKKFKEMAVALGEDLLPVVKFTISSVGLMIKGLSTLINFFLKNIEVIGTLAGTFAVLYAAKMKDIAVSKLQVFWNEKVMKVLAKVGEMATKHPWTLMAAGIVLVIAKAVELVRVLSGATTAQKALKDAQDTATAAFIEEKTRIDQLTKTVHDNTLSIDARRKAVEQLKGIIPGYNALINEEGRITNENTKAIDRYLRKRKEQLLLNAYEEQLTELYKKKAQLQSELPDEMESLGKGSPFGPLGYAWQSYGVAKDAAELQKAIEGIEKIERLMEEQRRKLDKMDSTGWMTSFREWMEGMAETTEKSTTPNEVDTKGYWTEELKKRQQALKELRNNSKATADEIEEAAKRVKEAEEKMELFTGTKQWTKEHEEAERKRKRELDERAKDAKGEYQAEVAEEMYAYRQGLETYEDYIRKKHSITQNYYDALKRIYGEDSTEYKMLLDNRERDEAEYYQWKARRDEKTLVADRLLRERSIRRQFMLQEVTDTDAMQEALFQSEITYMRQKANLYKKGSKERIDMETEIEEQMRQHQYLQEQEWLQKLSQYREQAGVMDYDKMMEMELKGADAFYTTLLDVGRMTQEEYDAIFEHIRRKYEGLKAQQTANSDIQEKASERLDTAKKNAGAKQVGAGSDAATGINAVSQAVSQQKLINEQLKLLYGADYENNREYQEAKRQLDAETMQQIVAGAQAAYSTISSLMSAASSYAQACSDAEVARITANYDSQIEAAGNNSKRKEKLEKERDKKIAAAKTAANKKAMAIELAQAIAQTSLGAISAYSSTMAGAPYPANLVLAPISAGIAIAAGMLQVATIKKQHEAQAAGYYEGGFTGGKRYRKEAGVVHEGEFVANHKAVQNPAIVPFLNFLDQAQRNNTVGSLTMQDVSRSMGAGGSTQVVAPIVNVQTDNEELREAVNANREATEMLVQKLDEGIESYTVMDGPNGLYHALKRYERLISKR